MSAARRTPLIAALPKMFFPLLVILPGIIAIGLPIRAFANNDVIRRGTTAAQIAAGTSLSGHRLAGRAGRGIIPPKMNAAGEAVRDSNGNVVLGLRSGNPQHAGEILPFWIVGARTDRAAREFHVRHGGQCHGIQHRLDLRHLSGAHSARRKRRSIISAWEKLPLSRESRFPFWPHTWPRASTTSWTCCN